ncbi:MAG: hypothetical protein IT448_00005 [Phycisphaerales bacterium]|nr:hypothetical protein [Phycisphaerales bacterium]
MDNQIGSKAVAFLFTGNPSTRFGVVINRNAINAGGVYQGEFGGTQQQ